MAKKKQKFGKYGNPFKLSKAQKRVANRRRLETKATIIKSMTKSDKPVSHIAADLSRAELKRDTGI